MIATAFGFELLPSGDVLIEFVGNDGKTINKQVVTPGVIKNMPAVAGLTDVALTKGPEVTKEIIEKLGRKQATFQKGRRL